MSINLKKCNNINTCLHINQDGSTKVTVYRKPTHADQYLNFHSNHHLQHKRAVVNTLLLRAQKLVSDKGDQRKEVQHIKEALKSQQLPRLAILNSETSRKGREEPQEDKKVWATIPYVNGTSERLQRAFKNHNITLVHKPSNSLRAQLVHVKDKTDTLIRNAEQSTTFSANNATKNM